MSTAPRRPGDLRQPIAAWVGVLVLCAACSERPATLNGDIFRTSADGDVKRFAGVTVYVLGPPEPTMAAVCRALGASISDDAYMQIVSAQLQASIRADGAASRAAFVEADHETFSTARRRAIRAEADLWARERDQLSDSLVGVTTDRKERVIAALDSFVVTKATTDASGHFTMEVPRAGTYLVHAREDEPDHATTWWTPVTLRADATTTQHLSNPLQRTIPLGCGEGAGR